MRLLRVGLLTAVMAILFSATSAEAWSWFGRKGGDGGGKGGGRPTRFFPTPEFDPAAAGAIASLLAGGGVLLARRRR